MVEAIKLTAEMKTSSGKGSSRALRREGKVPAIIYGKGQENIMVALNSKEIASYYSKAGFMTTVFDIVADNKKFHVLPRGVELNPVTDNVEHVDFLHVTDESTVNVKVRLHFINEDRCIGVKRGGTLNIVSRHIELLCKPRSIPQRIDIDLAAIDIGHNIHVKDLALPADVKLVSTSEQNLTIVTVVGRSEDAEDAKRGQ
jgi:large subunit ribosomal protein L25